MDCASRFEKFLRFACGLRLGRPPQSAIVRAPDVLPPAAIVVCANPADLDVSAVRGELPNRLVSAAERRQLEFLAGRQCARAALERLGIGWQPLGVGTEGAPTWPAGVVGSITHTRGFAAAAVAHARDLSGIGLDAETIMSPLRADTVHRRLALTRETESAMTATGLEHPVALTLVFSAKEALYKCLFPHVRRVFDYLDVAIDKLDPRARSFRATLLVPLSVRWRAGAVFEGRFEIIEDIVHTGVALTTRG